jgi:hypothetical protein
VPTSSILKGRHRAQPTADAPIGVSLLARVAKPVVAIYTDMQAERVSITSDMPAGTKSKQNAGCLVCTCRLHDAGAVDDLVAAAYI